MNISITLMVNVLMVKNLIFIQLIFEVLPVEEPVGGGGGGGKGSIFSHMAKFWQTLAPPLIEHINKQKLVCQFHI